MTISKQEMINRAFKRQPGLKRFFSAYVECLLWSGSDRYTGENFQDQDHDVEDITRDGIKEILSDCESFMHDACDMIEDDLSRAGQDFCLTRNDHGAGFWDGDWPENGDTLTKMCRPYGTQGLQLYRGKLYVHG